MERKEFEEFSKNFGRNELVNYLEKLEDGKTIDFTETYWGHSVEIKPNNNIIKGFMFDVVGFCAQKVNANDILKLKTKQGKILKTVILAVDNEVDPKDMFFGYLVSLGEWED